MLFLVPFDDVLIPIPVKGDIVSFTYDSFARRDLPINPKIYRVRSDLSWDDVVQSVAKDRKSLNGMGVARGEGRDSVERAVNEVSLPIYLFYQTKQERESSKKNL